MKKILLSLVTYLLVGAAHAGVINGSGVLVNQDVDWYSFSTTGTGNVSISAVETTSGDWGFDSVLFLFSNDGNLSNGDFIAYDDDGGYWLNSLLNVTLNAGDYLLAVATHGAWFNGSSIGGGHHEYTDYTLTISGDFVAANDVPEPGSIALLGLGLAGLGFFRNKKKA